MKSMRKIRRSKPNLRWRLPVLTLALLAAGVGIWWAASASWRAGVEWLAGTSWAVLDRIEVRGCVRLPEHDIITAAAVCPGVNLMHLDLDSVRAMVVELPGVRDARVFRRLPRRLVIRVEERVPIAGIGNGRLVLVDEEGVTFQPEYGGEVLDIPVITGDLKPHREDAGFDTTLELICDVKTNFPEIYRQLGEIRYKDEMLTLRLRQGGALVKAQNPTEPQLLRNLQLFLTQKGSELPASADYVDLRYPSMVISGTQR